MVLVPSTSDMDAGRRIVTPHAPQPDVVRIALHARTPELPRAAPLAIDAGPAPPLDASRVVDASPPADVDPAFAAMGEREHLVAARAAMADGYEREERVGGDLDLAQRHLDAIPPTRRSARRVQALREEIAARRARAQAMLEASAALDRQQQADRVTRGDAPIRLPSSSFYEVNHHMRELLSDPGSYEVVGCGPIRPQGPHWVVTCSFRARNELGLLGLNVWTYRLQAGRVVEAGPVR